MRTIADLFYASAHKYPRKTAIWCDGESVTYEELANLVSQFSSLLLQHGVAYRDHIGIPMNNSVISVALMLAAANIGAALVPISPTLPVEAVRTAFQAADVKHVIARSIFLEAYEQDEDVHWSGVTFCIDGERAGAIPLDLASQCSTIRPVQPDLTGEEIFIITMTSGSTGSPKPISLTQNNKLQRSFAHIDLYDVTADDRVLAATPLYHSLAERLVLMPLIIGGTSVLLPRFTPALWMDCVKQQQVTFTIAVSAQLNQIAERISDHQADDFNHLRCLVSSSALLEETIKDQLIDRLQCEFHEMYGTSETSTVTNINFRDSALKKSSVGKPLPGVEVAILKEDGQRAKAYEIGEISCSTPLLCAGYYGMPERFQKAMIEGFFTTGDLGYVDEDGFLYYSGRHKDLIITGGINVYPTDVDNCVKRLPEVYDCAAFAYPDERLGEIVALAVVLKDGAELTRRAIQVHCARNLADYQLPQRIYFIKELPTNSMGKLVRSQIMPYIHEQGISPA